MFQWFQSQTNNNNNQKIGFDDVIYAIRNDQNTCIIINTLSASCQDCLIQSTLPMENEERTINQLLSQYTHKDKRIIIYGKNATDPTPDQKYKQLVGLGFGEVYIYSGGLFEWLLLQDIYGVNEFPTTKKITDILKYKPTSILMIPRIGY